MLSATSLVLSSLEILGATAIGVCRLMDRSVRGDLEVSLLDERRLSAKRGVSRGDCEDGISFRMGRLGVAVGGGMARISLAADLPPLLWCTLRAVVMGEDSVLALTRMSLFVSPLLEGVSVSFLRFGLLNAKGSFSTSTACCSAS